MTLVDLKSDPSPAEGPRTASPRPGELIIMSHQGAIASRGVFLAILPFLAAQAAVPKAICRKGDKTESGMQGETTAAERDSGPKEYNCNADLVGQVQGEGASWQLAAW